MKLETFLNFDITILVLSAHGSDWLYTRFHGSASASK